MTDLFGNLDRPPGSPQLHRWADWAEVLCLTSGGLSIPDLASEVEARKDTLHTELDDEVEPDNRSAEELKNPFTSPDQFSDAVARRANDTFALIATRSVAYGEAYPFELDSAGRRLSLRSSRMDRLIYLYLLACAGLRYVPSKADQTLFSTRFEWLSLDAFRSHMPAAAEVHLFGDNPVAGSRYTGQIADKIRQLGQDIREEIRVDLAAEFPPPGSGDNGLDLVSWLPMGDAAPGVLSAFGQCAATPKWVEKQHSSSADAWESIFGFTVRPTNVCVIPYDFRKLDGDWYAKHSLHGAFLLDRRRLMATLGELDEHGGLRRVTQDTLDLLPLDRLDSLVAVNS